MSRFIGVKNNQISFVSDIHIVCEGTKIIEVPQELDNISNSELITRYKLRNNKIVSNFSKRNINDLKIALISNWKMECGIATYSEFVWTEVIKHLGDFKLFVEKNDNPTGPLNIVGNQILPEDKVSACWKRGESLQQLISEVNDYDPDIIWIQHEFGLWPNASHWLSLMTQFSKYRVIVTMHSVFHHKDKTICEAAMPEIVTHLSGGYDILKKEKQISGKVYVIPHGCFPCTNKEKLWNFYKSDNTFLQFGFGFRYKGWENSIKATAILKNKFSDIFFTGLFSESSYNQIEHQIYYNELMNLINELGVQENVAIIRGYQSDEVLNSFMRTNQATIFPYTSHPDHEVFGVSGAARFAMSKGLPVVTSSVNHFSDLPTIKANSPEEIAAALEKLFTNNVDKENQINKQLDYINENTWSKIALRYIALFENT